MSLVANYLEANGIPTVIIGSALDIVEHCGVPRFVFSDFPLGNPCGHPRDRGMQAEIVALALRQLELAEGPRTTVRAPFEWTDDPDWRARYNLITSENRARLRATGDARRTQRGQTKVEAAE